MSGGDTATGVVGMFLGILALVLAVAWVVFPFIVISKFNDLIKVARELLAESRRGNEHLAQIRHQPSEVSRQEEKQPIAEVPTHRI